MSVDFDPIRIGRRRRRIDPLAIGAAAVVVALAVAILKPWQSTGSAPGPQPSVAALSGASASPTASARPSRPPRPSTLPDPGAVLAPPGWTDLVGVATGRPDWGALAALGPSLRFKGSGAWSYEYAGLWDPGRPGSGRGSFTLLDPGDLAVVALGLTFPPGEAPDDVRIWQRRANDELEWVDVARVPGPSPDDPFVYVRPGPAGPSVEPWDAGRYRFDVLRGGRVDQLEVAVAAPSGRVPDPIARPATETRLVAPAASDPSMVRFGLFATVDGLGLSLHVANSRPFDEVDAWDATLGLPDRGPARTVATAFLPRATGLGVMLTPHASIRLAVLGRLAPSPLAPVPPTYRGISGSAGETPYIVFAAPEGEAFPPGVYAVSVAWSEGGGPHAATWHVELRPGPVAVRK